MNNLSFEYSYKSSKKSKKISIKITRDNQVVVTAPKLTPKFVVTNFIKKQQNWIVKTIETNKQKAKTAPNFNSKKSVTIFDKKYYKHIEFSSKIKTGIYIQDNKIIYNPLTIPIIKTNADEVKWQNKFTKKLDTFLKKTASNYIIPRTHQLGKLMGQKFNKITLRQQKTRWGSCSSQQNLNFNWRLVHFKTSIIDYVIIHELSHLTHMNHSKKFWQLVQTYNPNYLQHRGWLKRNSFNLH